VTGADSRTAVNMPWAVNPAGGDRGRRGDAGGPVFLTGPLGYVPIAALAAVIMVSAVGLFDFATLRELYRSSRRELLLSVATTLGVLLLGVLHGVLLAVVLSLLWLLAIGSRPTMPCWAGSGIKGFTTSPIIRGHYPAGLILYRFDANLVFFNVDYSASGALDHCRGGNAGGMVRGGCQRNQCRGHYRGAETRRTPGGTRGPRHYIRHGPRETKPDAVLQSGVGARASRAAGAYRFTTLNPPCAPSTTARRK